MNSTVKRRLYRRDSVRRWKAETYVRVWDTANNSWSIQDISRHNPYAIAEILSNQANLCFTKKAQSYLQKHERRHLQNWLRGASLRNHSRWTTGSSKWTENFQTCHRRRTRSILWEIELLSTDEICSNMDDNISLTIKNHSINSVYTFSWRKLFHCLQFLFIPEASRSSFFIDRTYQIWHVRRHILN